MKIFAAAIDTGGHRTKAVYDFCKHRFVRRIFAIKGAKDVNAPFVNRRASRKNSAGIQLFTVGVNAGKDDIYAKLQIKEPGPGYMHFPNRVPPYDDEYFRQLTAEKREARTGRWVKYRHRNEAIDCRNYANAALYIAGFDAMKLDGRRRYGIVVQKKTEVSSVKKNRTSGGWVNGYGKGWVNGRGW
jgi:phage terminase large subunit GpA-like protein